MQASRNDSATSDPKRVSKLAWTNVPIDTFTIASEELACPSRISRFNGNTSKVPPVCVYPEFHPITSVPEARAEIWTNFRY